MSRAELAVACDVTENTIRRWEKAETSISDRQKQVLAKVLGVPVATLIVWDETPTLVEVPR